MADVDKTRRTTGRLFAYGFRPFFLLAGLYAAAYVLLTLSVFVRVFGASALPFGYPIVVLLAGILWIAAFLPYLAVYGPILVKPRADGKPG